MAGGNRGPGTPPACRVAEIRSILLESVTGTDVQEIVCVLVTQAKAEDVVAAREILDRLIGKSAQAIALDAKLGIRPEPEAKPGCCDDVASMIRAYPELGLPREIWPLLPSEWYKNWLADEHHPTRPADFPAIVAAVQEKCDVWERKPKASS
ncbi:hypothetical protein [Humisphaera borealis]|uniref:hypothetical protein n=1 Tax=Humisphaera borealis TaxID=2807512 RepID=UPI0019D16190|nr:hypothetical protein [Humisphaera borealis]